MNGDFVYLIGVLQPECKVVERDVDFSGEHITGGGWGGQWGVGYNKYGVFNMMFLTGALRSALGYSCVQ